MRLVTVRGPEGTGKKIAEMAFAAGVAQVSLSQARQLMPGDKEVTVDVADVQTATPIAKTFIEGLMASSWYDPTLFSFTIRHPESIFASEPPETETYPVVRPTTDVYEELWQFTRVTGSLLARVFLSAVLLSYGLVKGMLPLMIAGLLFLPFHHHLLGIGLGGVLREWRFFRQGLLALVVSTGMIMLGGVCVALFTSPPIEYQDFGSPVSGVVLAAVIGAAAAFGALDDAGRRELVGLAATAHISIYPAWLGLQLVFGSEDSHRIKEHLLTFGLNLVTLTLAAALIFALMGMRGTGIRRFVARKS